MRLTKFKKAAESVAMTERLVPRLSAAAFADASSDGAAQRTPVKDGCLDDCSAMLGFGRCATCALTVGRSAVGGMA